MSRPKVSAAARAIADVRGRIGAELGEIRQRIEALRDERRTVAAMPAGTEEARARVDHLIADLASLASMRAVGELAYRDGTEAVIALKAAAATAGPWPAICAALPEAVRKAWYAAVDAEIAKAGGGITSEERKARLAELVRQQIDAEIAEEAVIADAEAAGIAIDRRPDCSTEIVLFGTIAKPQEYDR